MDETESPPQKRRFFEALQSGTENKPERQTQVPFVVRKVEHAMEQHSKTSAVAPQGAGLDEDGTVTFKTLRESWNMKGPENSPNNATPAQRVKEMLEPTHDLAARDMFPETQKAMGKRTIVVGPDGLQQCLANIRNSNQCKLPESMGKGKDLLLLGIWDYIWQWADRILSRIPEDVVGFIRSYSFMGLKRTC